MTEFDQDLFVPFNLMKEFLCIYSTEIRTESTTWKYFTVEIIEILKELSSIYILDSLYTQQQQDKVGGFNVRFFLQFLCRHTF